MRDVLRAEAMTLWPLERASRAMYLPKPLEAAVMNQTGVWDILGSRDGMKSRCVEYVLLREVCTLMK